MNAMLQASDIRVGRWKLDISVSDATDAIWACSDAFHTRLAAAAFAPTLADKDPGADTIVIIEALRAPLLHINPSGEISDLEAFQRAFGEAIDMARRTSRTAQFRDRYAACIAFAQAVARRDATLLWVWRALGFLSENPAPAPAALTGAEAASRVMSLLEKLDEDLWPALMTLAATGDLAPIWRLASIASLEGILSVLDAPDAQEPDAPSSDVANTSVRLIFATAPHLAGMVMPGDFSRARLAARLAAIPCAGRLPTPAATGKFLAAATAFYANAGETVSETEPAVPRQSKAGKGDRPDAVRDDRDRDTAIAGRPPAGIARETQPGDMVRSTQKDDSPGAADAPTAFDIEPSSLERTAFGGLLFTLHVVPQSDLFEAFARGELAGMALHDVMRLIAIGPFGIPASDPVVDVFGGLWPGRFEGQGQAQASPSIRQKTVIARIGRSVETLARKRLPDMETLSVLLRREGTLDVKPGKVVMTLPLSSVDTALRRSGLDIDPGFLPWLGMVVRFAYE